MKILVGLLALFSASVFAANPVSVVPTDAMAFSVTRWMGPVPYKYTLGTVIKQAHNTAVGTYDFAVNGGAIASHEVGITLPNKAIVRNVFFDVVTALASSGSALLGFQVESSADLEPFTAYGSWTGKVQGTPTGAVGTMIELTAQRKVYAVVSGAVMSAGKVKVFVDYVVSE